MVSANIVNIHAARPAKVNAMAPNSMTLVNLRGFPSRTASANGPRFQSISVGLREVAFGHPLGPLNLNVGQGFVRRLTLQSEKNG